VNLAGGERREKVVNRKLSRQPVDGGARGMFFRRCQKGGGGGKGRGYGALGLWRTEPVGSSLSV